MVEGITDKFAIGSIIKKILDNDKIDFQIMDGDITSELQTDTNNIIRLLGTKINKYMIKGRYKLSDFNKIVQLVDTDGAYVEDDKIVYKDLKNIIYTEENIQTNNIDYMKTRNKKKSRVLNRLISTNNIKGIPYEIYFFSSNLEHVLHNEQNVFGSKEKMKYADEFNDKFINNPDDFLNFINSDEFAVNGEYKETWCFVQEDTNSLKRYTNLNVFFKNNLSK